jgi:hypothetical protein
MYTLVLALTLLLICRRSCAQHQFPTLPLPLPLTLSTTFTIARLDRFLLGEGGH